MSGPRERELKLRIASLDAFLDLRDGTRWGTRSTPQRQVNHYFDTGDLLLARRRILLRIREAAGCVLTLKCGREVSPGSFDSLELERDVDRAVLARALADPATILDLGIAPVGELLRRVGRIPLVVAGTLVNERVRRGVGGWTLEVDRVTFPDGTESFEVEIETEDVERLELWVERELLGRGICVGPQRRTKLEQLIGWRSACDSADVGPREPQEPIGSQP